MHLFLLFFPYLISSSFYYELPRFPLSSHIFIRLPLFLTHVLFSLFFFSTSPEIWLLSICAIFHNENYFQLFQYLSCIIYYLCICKAFHSTGVLMCFLTLSFLYYLLQLRSICLRVQLLIHYLSF